MDAQLLGILKIEKEVLTEFLEGAPLALRVVKLRPLGQIKGGEGIGYPSRGGGGTGFVCGGEVGLSFFRSFPSPWALFLTVAAQKIYGVRINPRRQVTAFAAVQAQGELRDGTFT